MFDVRLISVRLAARDTHLFEFERADGGPLPPAEAGAHVDLHLPNGLVRQYSLTMPAAAPRSYLLGVKLDPASRGGSRYLFERLKLGQGLAMSEPRNNFPLVEGRDPVVLIAGGIGITPIRAMVQRLEADRRAWELHYSCRSRDDMAFLAELQGKRAARLHFDDEAGGRFLDIAAIVRAASPAAHFYCCGPPPMLEAFAAVTRHRPPKRVHVEYFTPQAAPSLEGGFTVRLARSDREFVVPSGKSILQVLLDAGLDVPFSCEQGICGTCETAVISGVPDHRDSVLSESEHAANKTMMICCSGSKSAILVIDR